MGGLVKKDFLIMLVGKTAWSGLAAGQDLTSLFVEQREGRG